MGWFVLGLLTGHSFSKSALNKKMEEPELTLSGR